MEDVVRFGRSRTCGFIVIPINDLIEEALNANGLALKRLATRQRVLRICVRRCGVALWFGNREIFIAGDADGSVR